MLVPTGLGAQATPDPGAALGLPRPGYEPRAISAGPVALDLQGEVTLSYDDNVFATHRDPAPDEIIRPGAILNAGLRSGSTEYIGQAYFTRQQHVRYTRESSNLFGGSLRARRNSSGRRAFSVHAAYNRTIESRADPEARATAQQSPTKIDNIVVEGEYELQGARLSAAVSGAYRLYNYLRPQEDDRDLQSFEGSIRLGYLISQGAALFIQPYAVRRQFRLAEDFSGVGRSAVTTGAIAGLQGNLTTKISGRAGVGFFRFLPDAPSLPARTGFAAQAAVTWTPRPRMRWTLSANSGDVGTVRAGATGRQDTLIALRLDQEIRHNLLLGLNASWEQFRYRGVEDSNRRTCRIGGELTYLVNRTVGLVAGVAFTDRTATEPKNSFRRTIVTIGLRVRH